MLQFFAHHEVDIEAPLDTVWQLHADVDRDQLCALLVSAYTLLCDAEDPPLLGSSTCRGGREDPGQGVSSITVAELASEAHHLGLISHLSRHRRDVEEAWPDLGMDHPPVPPGAPAR
jgi:hypothetical protein